MRSDDASNKRNLQEDVPVRDRETSTASSNLTPSSPAARSRRRPPATVRGNMIKKTSYTEDRNDLVR